MAKQYDVFQNPFKDRAAYPLLVVLQSPFAKLTNTRIVAPAVLAPGVSTASGQQSGGVLTPRFTVDGRDYTLQTFQLTSMKLSDLKQHVANISDARDRITTALDHLFHDNS
jgi:hypothetical protein